MRASDMLPWSQGLCCPGPGTVPPWPWDCVALALGLCYPGPGIVLPWSWDCATLVLGLCRPGPGTVQPWSWDYACPNMIMHDGLAELACN